MLKYLHPVSFIRVPVKGRHGKLFASPMPYGPYDKANRLLKLYRHAHVKCVVMLVTTEEMERKARKDLRAVYLKHGMEVLHCPIEDYTAPTVENLGPLVRKIAERLHRKNLAIHCNAGVGRTAVVAAATLSEVENMNPDISLERLHDLMHIEITEEQRRLVRAWWKECHRA